MNYRTILVHLDSSGRSPVRAALAAQWAKAHESHLVGLVPTGPYGGAVPADAVATGVTDYIADAASRLRLRAEAISRKFRQGIHASGHLSYELRLVDGAAVDAVVRHGRASDLLVLGQDDESDAGHAAVRSLAQQVLMEAGRPLLVVPCASDFGAPAKNAVVTWDGSRESTIAIHAALPALRRASRVTLVSYRHPDEEDDEQRLLMPEMIQFLLRHGIQARAEREVTEIDIADALLSRISDLGADLLVMGGYGHSRFRERVLGGVTRQILAQMTVPVLMAH
ncbi:nucleotide-binding universal stress UspA family protein [Variovorax beijingensis]|jgi:nucleotide-binding universal stress UspA family protein|uniref:Nucleotide-binding universal stress UspA family protein n=2 Tax=Variovorax TaxID=34072 RepID=A0AAE4BZF9_VARPD|nr:MULTISPECIES: universal stress protein [Variovorax]MDR6427430.1 nucleotide-binding universal stress UspA family protein [Variovorax paradoxus]MDR6454592.1 nucleotide-binding universal stress UspA family protein [Variovorax paradoxus]TWD85671.1 nucleotide-binding universal stress UspA family protein [Variovorax beijingensis]